MAKAKSKEVKKKPAPKSVKVVEPVKTLVGQIKELSYEERSKLIPHLAKAHQKDVEKVGGGQEPAGEGYTELEN